MEILVAMLDIDSTSAQRNAVTEWLRAHQQVGFWHHIEHSWIIAVPNNELDVEGVRSKLQELAPNINSMVVMAKKGVWSGVAPMDGHKWLEDYLKA